MRRALSAHTLGYVTRDGVHVPYTTSTRRPPFPTCHRLMSREEDMAGKLPLAAFAPALRIAHPPPPLTAQHFVTWTILLAIQSIDCPMPSQPTRQVITCRRLDSAGAVAPVGLAVSNSTAWYLVA